MRQLQAGRHALTTLVVLNIDRILVTGSIAGTMLFAAWLQSL